jgi:SagB-type dehydrogenase family enzyme
MYTGDSISLPYLAAIAQAACGITGYIGEDPRNGKRHSLALHSTPSGGGLYPLTLQIAALRVDNLPRGIFTYDPHANVLWQRGDETNVKAVLKSLANPTEIISSEQASAICFLTGRPWRSMRKYGPRGMRYVFIEAGAIAEHINLTAVALGLGSVDCASFYDDEANEALDIDGLYETLIHAIFLGVPG